MSLTLTQRHGFNASGLDPMVAAFVASSGAVDVAVTNQLIRYLRGQSLLSDIRFFPFKSTQNAGTGTTVYGLGEWTSNNITLDVGGTWASDGLDMDATDDRASITLTGLKSITEMYVFSVQKPVAASAADADRFGYSSFGDQAAKYFFLHGASGLISGETVCAGINTPTARRKGTAGITWSADEKTQIVVRANATLQMWKSKSEATLDKTSGTNSYAPADATWATDDVWRVHSAKNGAGWAYAPAATLVAHLYCKTSLTQAQRETITDYLDAL